MSCKKSSTSKVLHVHNTGFYMSFEIALHKHFITSENIVSEWKELQLIASFEKCLAFEKEFSFNLLHTCNYCFEQQSSKYLLGPFFNV